MKPHKMFLIGAVSMGAFATANAGTQNFTVNVTVEAPEALIDITDLAYTPAFAEAETTDLVFTPAAVVNTLPTTATYDFTVTNSAGGGIVLDPISALFTGVVTVLGYGFSTDTSGINQIVGTNGSAVTPVAPSATTSAYLFTDANAKVRYTGDQLNSVQQMALEIKRDTSTTGEFSKTINFTLEQV